MAEVGRKGLPQSDTEDFIVADTLTFLETALHARATGRDPSMVEYVIRNAVKRAWAAAVAQASPSLPETP